MPEDEWALTDEAASIIGERRVQRAWRDPSFPFRGVRHAIPRTREPVEIPYVDRRRLDLDCRRRRAGRPQLWDYELVEMRTADIERLAQEARTPSPQSPRAGIRRTHAGAVLREGFIAPGRRNQSGIDLGRVDLTGAATARQEEADPAAANTPVSEATEQPPQSANTAKPRARKVSRRVKKVADFLFNEWSERPPTLSVGEMLTFVLTKTHPCGKSTVERAIQWLEEQGKWGK
jgi:hypothetical protein